MKMIPMARLLVLGAYIALLAMPVCSVAQTLPVVPSNVPMRPVVADQ